jgi:GNAT superfamily N-acetyltransferase
MNSRFTLAHAIRLDSAFGRGAPMQDESCLALAEPTSLNWSYRLEPTQKYRWFVGRIVERIERLGLRVSVRHDFDEFVTTPMPGYHEAVNPAFDPRYSDLRPNRAFWLRVDDGRGEMVACIAGKVFRFPSLYARIADLSIWYDDDPTLPHDGERVEMISEASRGIGGVVSMTGRLWTHPDWRNRGLSSYLPLLARTMLLARHGVDYHFGFANAELVRKQVPFLRYGFPRAEPCMRVKLMSDPREIELWLVWMSRAEMIADVDDCVSDN